MHYHQRILSLVLILATNISAYTVHNNRENLSKTRDGGFFSNRRTALAQIAALSSTLSINPVSYIISTLLMFCIYCVACEVCTYIPAISFVTVSILSSHHMQWMYHLSRHKAFSKRDL